MFSGSANNPPPNGMPSGFNDMVLMIQFTTSMADAGNLICLDKTEDELAPWEWTSGSFSWEPSWAGPYCFEVVPYILTPFGCPSICNCRKTSR